MENVPLFAPLFKNQEAEGEITGIYSRYFIQID
jgi:hypothetical protein